MNPFKPSHGSRLRVVCQIVRIDRDSEGTIVDLITLEPASVHGTPVSAGTPFTLGFTADHPQAQDELDGALRRWEQTCATLDLGVDDMPTGMRYEFSSGHRMLVVTVDDSSGRRI
jgi:hypothetical protein